MKAGNPQQESYLLFAKNARIVKYCHQKFMEK